MNNLIYLVPFLIMLAAICVEEKIAAKAYRDQVVNNPTLW
jgi:hypothetical protein